MKKVIVFGLALFLILSMAGVSSAAEEYATTTYTTFGEGQERSTYVSYNVPSSVYTVTIPDTIVFTNLENTMLSYVNVSNVLLDHGKAVEVHVKSEHRWVMELHKDDVALTDTVGILYNMTFRHPDTNSLMDFHYYMDDDNQNQVICQIAEATDFLSIPVSFEIASSEHIDHSGTYQDRLRFTIHTVDVSS